MEERLRKLEELVHELEQRLERAERLYASLAIDTLNPAEIRTLYTVDKLQREKGIGATIKEITEAMGYDYEAMREHVGRRLRRLESRELVLRRRNPGRKVRPRPHGALYIFEVNRELLRDVPSLLRELGHKDVVEEKPLKRRKMRRRNYYQTVW